MSNPAVFSYDPNDILTRITSDLQTKDVTIKSGEGALSRGQVVAREKSSGKHIKYATPVTSEDITLTTNPANPNGVTEVKACMASIPAIPGSVIAEVTVQGVTATLHDNTDGLLYDISGNQAADGKIDYSSGNMHVNTTGAMVTTDTLKLASYQHFNKTVPMDIHDVGVLVNDVDATDEDKPGCVYTKANLDPAKLTPAIDNTDVEQEMYFRKHGLNLETRY